MGVWIFWAAASEGYGPPTLATPRTGRFDVADLDGDGDGDLCVAVPDGRCAQHSEVFVLTQDDRTFAEISSFRVRGDVLGFVIAELDGDRNVDLAVGTTESLELRSGRGDGAFDTPLELGPGGGPAAADLDGDGDLDLVAAGERDSNPNAEQDEGVVYRNERPGVFTIAQRFAAGNGGVILADLDLDGTVDIVTGGGWIHWGDGGGNFLAGQKFLRTNAGDRNVVERAVVDGDEVEARVS